MAFIDNRGYARVDSNPNTIAELQTGHQILIACHTTDQRVWKYVPTNPAGAYWEIIHDFDHYYMEQFQGLGDQSTHDQDKSFSVNSIDVTASQATYGVANTAIYKWVLAGNGFLYGVPFSGGAKVVKFDPKIDEIVGSYDVTGQHNGNYYSGIYRPADNKLYFPSTNGSMIIFDLVQEEVSVSLSGFTVPPSGARNHWTDVDCNKIYSLGLRSNDLYIYDIEAGTHTSVNPGFPNVNGTSTGMDLYATGVGKDNICYISTTRLTNTTNSGGSDMFKFDCNTDTLDLASELNLSRKGVFANSVFGPDRRYIYMRSARTDYTQGAGNLSIMVFDTETYTEVAALSKADISEGGGTTATSTLGGILGLDGKAMWIPDLRNTDNKWFITIETDGSLVAEAIDVIADMGLGVADRGIFGLQHALNGAVYSGILDNNILKITYHDKRYEPLEVHRYHDSLKY